MVFVYLLALIGLLALIALAVVALTEPTESPEPEADPYEDALGAVARIQAGAWQAVEELRQLDRREEG